MPQIDRKRARAPMDQPVVGVETFPLKYPDRARDIETLLVDPDSGEVVARPQVVVRHRRGGRVQGAARDAGRRRVDPRGGRAARRSAPGEQVTSGDVAPSGDAIALRTYSQVLLYRRAPGTPLETAYGAAVRATRS